MKLVPSRFSKLVNEEVLKAELIGPGDQWVSLSLHTYINELALNDTVLAINKINALFEWACNQGIEALGLYSTISLLRSCFSFKESIDFWPRLRDQLVEWCEVTNYQDSKRLLCGLC